MHHRTSQCTLHLPSGEVPGVVKFMGTENVMVVSRIWDGGQLVSNGELLFNSYRVSIGEDEEVLKLDGTSVCTTM